MFQRCVEITLEIPFLSGHFRWCFCCLVVQIHQLRGGENTPWGCTSRGQGNVANVGMLKAQKHPSDEVYLDVPLEVRING